MQYGLFCSRIIDFTVFNSNSRTLSVHNKTEPKEKPAPQPSGNIPIQSLEERLALPEENGATAKEPMQQDSYGPSLPPVLVSGTEFMKSGPAYF